MNNARLLLIISVGALVFGLFRVRLFSKGTIFEPIERANRVGAIVAGILGILLSLFLMATR